MSFVGLGPCSSSSLLAVNPTIMASAGEVAAVRLVSIYPIESDGVALTATAPNVALVDPVLGTSTNREFAPRSRLVFPNLDNVTGLHLGVLLAEVMANENTWVMS